MKYRFNALFSLGILAFAVSINGCRPKAQVSKDPAVVADPQAQAAEEPSLRGKEYSDVPELSAIYFDLDASTLRDDARESLRKNYDALKAHPDWEVLIEGHCDERGTTEYNLGLGQRRAASVRQYYMSLGVSGTRLATLSYGKEKPVCEDKSEDCWARNRRAASKARVNPAKAN